SDLSRGNIDVTIGGAAAHLWAVRRQPGNVQVLSHAGFRQQTAEEKQALSAETCNLQTIIDIRWAGCPRPARKDAGAPFIAGVPVQSQYARHILNRDRLTTMRAMFALG